MRRFIRRFLPVCVTLVGVVGAAAAPRTSPPQATPEAKRPALTGPARQRAKRLLSDFRGAKRFPDKRAAAATELLALGPAAAAQLLEAVNVELEPQVARYRQDYQQAASTLAARRAVNPNELAAMRQIVLSQKDDPQLSKEAIESRDDPARIRLLVLLCIPRDDLVRARPALGVQRTALAGLGAYWQQARQVVAQADAQTAATSVSFDEYLSTLEEDAATLAMPMDDAARRVLVENASLTGQVDPDAARGIAALNRLRVALGLRPLLIDPKLCLASADHSNDMRTLNFFAHESPVPGKTTSADRAKNFGASASAENIAQAREPLDAIEMWWHSPGHHRNMLGDHKRVGLGRSEKFWTQMFGR